MTGGAGDGLAGLSAASLVEEAVLRAGAGAAPTTVPFTANLELLVASCRDHGALSPTGATVLAKAALRHLRNVLEVDAHLVAQPGVRERPLTGPVVVTGLPRTGTTLLHNLLALDPAHRALRFWEALRPVPPGPDGPSVEARQAQAAAWLEAFYRLVPEFQSIHAATPTGPEECDALLQNTFASQHFDDMFDAPAYSDWLATAPLAAEYRHYALQLRVLTSASPPGPTWALKSPSHLGHLDALLAALPGVTVVVCHRDPREAVASYASLIHTLRRPYTLGPDPAVAGRQALARASVAMGRAMETRDSMGAGAPFVDVSYPGLEREPLAAVAEVYEQMGRTLPDEASGPMAAWVAENPRHRRGPHRYDLERFGLEEDEVLTIFEPYLARFGGFVR
ncbi:MAG: sulfotransferase family protein [Acidimicrobiales bacterium]